MYSKEELKQRNLVWDANSLPYNPALNNKAKHLRKNMTKHEKKLWYEFLSKLDIRFLRQKIIDNYIVDFYCAKHKLVIEIDGSQHYTDDGIAYDNIKEDILSLYNIKIIRFTNLEVDKYFDIVCHKISDAID